MFSLNLLFIIPSKWSSLWQGRKKCLRCQIIALNVILPRNIEAIVGYIIVKSELYGYLSLCLIDTLNLPVRAYIVTVQCGIIS